MKKKILVLIVLILIPIFSFGAAGLMSVLDIGPGVKQQSLGGAYIAGIDDACSVFYNPASLDTVEKIEINGAYIPLFYDTIYNYICFGIPTVDFGTFGFSFAKIDTDKIILRDSKGINIGETRQELMEVILGWGSEMFIENLYAGMNIKIDRESFADTEDAAVGIDFSVLYKILNGENIFNAAITIKNLMEPGFKLEDNKDVIKRYYIAGLAYERRINKVSVSLYADTVMPLGVDFEERFGVDVSVFDVFALRAGFNTANIYSIGAGLKLFDMVSVDYGMFFTEIDNQQRVSAAVRLGEKVTYKRTHKKELRQKKIEQEAKLFVKKELKEMKNKFEEINRTSHKNEYFKAFHYTKALEAYNDGSLKLSQAEFMTVFKIDSGYLNVKYYVSLLKNLEKNRKNIMYDENILSLYRDGVGKYMQEDYKGAKVSWEKILKIDPYNKLAIENLKEVNELLRNVEK